MKLLVTVIFSLIGCSVADVLSSPELLPRHVSPKTLEKRRGGGGRSGGSSSSGSSSSGSRSSGSSSSGSGIGSIGSSSGSSRISSSLTRYGTGRFFRGGSRSPFRSGNRSPRGLAPILLPVAAASAIYPGWLVPAYYYAWTRPYTFNNQTDTDGDGVRTTLPVGCLCEEVGDCSCDTNDDDNDFLNTLVDDGDVDEFDKSLLALNNVNGTQTLLLNGTIPAGATDGDDDDDDDDSGSTGAASRERALRFSGYSIMIFTLLYACLLL